MDKTYALWIGQFLELSKNDNQPLDQTSVCLWPSFIAYVWDFIRFFFGLLFFLQKEIDWIKKIRDFEEEEKKKKELMKQCF